MTSRNSSANFKEKRVYGRRSGKALNKSRAEAIEKLLPELCVPEDKLLCTGNLKLIDLFSAPHKTNTFEIGFGGGEHLHGLIEQNPDAGFLGAEPFLNGMASFLKDLTKDDHENVRVIMDDAMLLAESLEDECLDKIYILNPDPWHKARHHKRRIVSTKNLDHFARILKPGGQLISSTDVPYLAEWIVEKTTEHPRFDWGSGYEENWKTRPDWWIDNRYATKGAKGATEMHYMVFDKID